MIQIDVKTGLICLVLIALLVLIIVAIVLVIHAITAVKNLNKVTDDASTITGIAATKATEIDGAIGNLGEQMNDLTKAIKGNQNFIGAAANVGKAVASSMSYIRSGERAEKAEKKRDSGRSRKRTRK